MAQMTYQSSESADAAQQLRIRGTRMLELAARAYCEQHHDFARLLTWLAAEVFAHAKEAEQSYALCRSPIRSTAPASRRR